MSVTYWDASHDTVSAHCHASLHADDATRTEVWGCFAAGPEPVGYDPAIIHAWQDGPLTPGFTALRLDPWRVRVQPAPVLLEGKVELVKDWTS